MKTLPAAMLLVLAATYARAELTLEGGTTIAFASVEQGKMILKSPDDFVERMSSFDRASRMKTDKDVSEEDYLEFVGRNVLAWNSAEKQKVTSAIQGVRKELEKLSLPLPEKVYIVKTTGREEGDAAYTRANAIVLPQARLQQPVATLRRLFCHELFHVMSRANPDFRDRLYAVIGFARCGELAFPPELKPQKITNPDAPINEHCIRLSIDGRDRWAVPILFSSAERYDTKRGGEFFSYLQFRFLLVEPADDSPAVKPMYENGDPALVDIHQLSGFFEQVGNNTRYIIHPEEILADNFALLVLQERNLASPEIVRKLETVLREYGTAAPTASAAADTKPR